MEDNAIHIDKIDKNGVVHFALGEVSSTSLEALQIILKEKERVKKFLEEQPDEVFTEIESFREIDK